MLLWQESTHSRYSCGDECSGGTNSCAKPSLRVKCWELGAHRSGRKDLLAKWVIFKSLDWSSIRKLVSRTKSEREKKKPNNKGSFLSNFYGVYSESSGGPREFTGNVKEEKVVSGSGKGITKLPSIKWALLGVRGLHYHRIHGHILRWWGIIRDNTSSYCRRAL